MTNPAHFKWTDELRNAAQEILDTSPNSVIATQIFNERFGGSILPGTFRRALIYLDVRDGINAKKRALTARPAVQKKKRACLNACGRAMVSTGPHHRLCEPCRASLSSLPAQFS